MDRVTDHNQIRYLTKINFMLPALAHTPFSMFSNATARCQHTDHDLKRIICIMQHNACCRVHFSVCIFQYKTATQSLIHSRNNTNAHEMYKRFLKLNTVQFLNGCGYRTKGSPWYDVTRGSGAQECRAKINSGHNLHLSQVITGQ